MIAYNGKFARLPDFVNWGDIIELPWGFSLRQIKKKSKNAMSIVVFKAKKVSYKSFLSKAKKYKFIRRYLEVPKIFKKLPLGMKNLGGSVAYDPILNIFGIIYTLRPTHYDLNLQLTKISVLGLQN